MAFDDGVKTVSGSIAHTDDAATKVPFVSVKCGIEPTLDGVTEITAYNVPSVNLLSLPDVDFTLFGVHIYTVKGILYMDGASTTEISSTRNEYKALSFYLPKGTYYFTRASYGLPSYIYKYSDKSQVRVNNGSFTLTEGTMLYMGYYIYQKTFSKEKFDQIVSVGSSSTAYVDTVTKEVYNATLGRTIYGGQAEIVNGEGKKTYGYIDLGSLTYTRRNNVGMQSNGISSLIQNPPDNYTKTTAIASDYTADTWQIVMNSGTSSGLFGVSGGYICFSTTETDTSAFKASMSGKYLVFPLATPTDFTFTPVSPTPETVGKVNNVYCNTGNTELTYYDNAHGFSEVTVNKTGRNLLSGDGGDIPKTSQGVIFSVSTGIYTVEATENKTGYPFALMAKFDLKKGTYTISLENVIVGLQLRVINRNVSPSQTIATTGNNTSATFTISADITDISFEIAITASSISEGTYIIKPQLEVGSTAHAYEPYEVVSKTAYLHKVIYGGQADVVKGTCEPKNLIHVPYYASSGSVSGGITYTYDNMGRVTCNGENTGTGNSVFYLERGVYIQNYPSGTYYFSQEGFPYQSGTASTVQLTICSKLDSTVTQRIQLYSNTTGKSLTVSDNEYINDIFIRIASGKSADFTVNIQLEKGGTGTDFSPYFTPFSFPPISMSTDEGENTLFANEGDSAITYRKAVD